MPCAFIKEDTLIRMFETNVHSIMQLQGQLFAGERINDAASLVFMSSVAAWSFSRGNTVYAMTKAALEAYVKHLALEWAPRKIRASSICPATVETPLIYGDPAWDEEDGKRDVKGYPLGRYGQPEDIAHLAAFLLSDASSWVTASSYAIDGGIVPR